MGSLFQELKRRKVFRVAAGHAILAWSIIPVDGKFLSTLNILHWVDQTIIPVSNLGLLVSMVGSVRSMWDYLIIGAST